VVLFVHKLNKQNSSIALNNENDCTGRERDGSEHEHEPTCREHELAECEREPALCEHERQERM